MQHLKDRFERCDPRFFTYLEKVLERLPPDVKKEILDNERFQLLADEAFHEACVLRHRFEDSVENLVYLNTKLLKESEHRIILTIAHEIAMVMACKTRGEEVENEAEDLLIQWGFGKELEAVRYDQVIANSEGYKAGYKWAIHQDKDYLLQHFGLYFDEWNKMGWSKRPEGALQMLDQKSEKAPILKDLSQLMDQKAGESDDEAGEVSPSQRQAILAGIMTAVKEIELREQYSSQSCEVRY
jgi:hypothetical protein